MPIDWDKLRVFHAVAEAGSFTHAGETLNLSQSAVSRQIRVPLTPWQRAALIDFTYNLGEEALAGSTLARLFNAGQAQAGCEQLSRWVKARVQGELVTLRGLVDRRGAELEVCLG